MQEAAGDRGIRAGWRLHEKTNEAIGGNDPFGAQLPVAGGLQDR